MAKDLNYTLSLKDLFSKQMRGAVNETNRMDSKISSLDSGFSKLGGVIAGAFSVGSVVAFGGAVIESLKNYEYFHAGLKTMLHGNTLATSALENQLVNLAKTTPFELTEVQTATKQLLAYGFKAGDVVKTMRTLGDVSSGIGAPLGDIAYLYGTLKTSGRVTLMDLRQFAGRGIPIYETLAKRLNTTSDNINKMVSTGKIGFKDIEGAFKDMTKEGGQFFNLMEDQSKTVGGKISNLADSWEQIKVKIGKSQTGIISGTIDFLSKLTGQIDFALGIQGQMETQFNKFGVKGQSTFDKGLQATLGVVDQLSQAQFKLNTITESGLTNKVKLQMLSNLFAETEGKRLAGTLTQEQSKARMALIQGSIDSVRGGMMLNKQKENPNLGLSEKANGKLDSLAKTDTSSGVNLTANRPQSLVININELVHELKVQAGNLTESTMKIKEEVSKIFLEMVNDANLAIR